MKALSPCCRAGGLLSPCWSLPGHKELVCWAAASVVYLMGTRFGEGWKIKVKWARRRKLHPFFPFGRINRLLLSTSLHSRSDVGSREGVIGDVKHGRHLLERFAHLLEPLRSPQLRLFLRICSSMLLLQLRLSQSQTRMGPLLVLHQGSFPLRESIEAFVSDWFILWLKNGSTFKIEWVFSDSFNLFHMLLRDC